MASETAQILEELRNIRSGIDYIKNHLTDADVLMTDDDWESIRQAETDLKTGKTKKMV